MNAGMFQKAVKAVDNGIVVTVLQLMFKDISLTSFKNQLFKVPHIGNHFNS